MSNKLGSCRSNALIGIPKSSELPFQLSPKDYPNPVHNAVKLEVLYPKVGTATFEALVDIAGRGAAVAAAAHGGRPERSEVEFMLGTLPMGIYLLQSVEALVQPGVA